MTYWVVSAGALGRDYTKAFLDFGMAFVGGKKPLLAHAQIKPADILLLKRGLSEILAAGRVVDRGAGHAGRDDKDWLRDFDGWDLTGYCYVDWHVPEAPIKASPSMGLRQGTIYPTNRPELRAIAEQLLTVVPARPPTRPEPIPQRQIGDQEILQFLIAQGLRPSAADELTNTLRRIRLLASYYYHQCGWEDVREHETRTFLVVPLLLALGWSEQQLKIEYPTKSGRVDIVCFARAYRAKGQDSPVLIETKDFKSGLDYAPAQATGYAAEFPSCRAVLVTNGYCYKLYRRSEAGGFSTTPTAYLNLLRPRENYPLDPSVPGALEVLGRLLPGGIDDL